MNRYDKEFNEFVEPETEGSYCELWNFCRYVLTHVRHLERQIKAKNKIIEENHGIPALHASDDVGALVRRDMGRD